MPSEKKLVTEGKRFYFSGALMAPSGCSKTHLLSITLHTGLPCCCFFPKQMHWLFIIFYFFFFTFFCITFSQQMHNLFADIFMLLCVFLLLLPTYCCLSTASSEAFPTHFKALNCSVWLNQHNLMQNYPNNILTYLHFGRPLSSI